MVIMCILLFFLCMNFHLVFNQVVDCSSIARCSDCVAAECEWCPNGNNDMMSPTPGQMTPSPTPENSPMPSTNPSAPTDQSPTPASPTLASPTPLSPTSQPSNGPGPTPMSPTSSSATPAPTQRAVTRTLAPSPLATPAPSPVVVGNCFELNSCSECVASSCNWCVVSAVCVPASAMQCLVPERKKRTALQAITKCTSEICCSKTGAGGAQAPPPPPPPPLSQFPPPPPGFPPLLRKRNNGNSRRETIAFYNQGEFPAKKRAPPSQSYCRPASASSSCTGQFAVAKGQRAQCLALPDSLQSDPSLAGPVTRDDGNSSLFLGLGVGGGAFCLIMVCGFLFLCLMKKRSQGAASGGAPAKKAHLDTDMKARDPVNRARSSHRGSRSSRSSRRSGRISIQQQYAAAPSQQQGFSAMAPTVASGHYLAAPHHNHRSSTRRSAQYAPASAAAATATTNSQYAPASVVTGSSGTLNSLASLNTPTLQLRPAAPLPTMNIAEMTGNSAGTGTLASVSSAPDTQYMNFKDLNEAGGEYAAPQFWTEQKD